MSLLYQFMQMLWLSHLNKKRTIPFVPLSTIYPSIPRADEALVYNEISVTVGNFVLVILRKEKAKTFKLYVFNKWKKNYNNILINITGIT
jgi:hypothetical protein